MEVKVDSGASMPATPLGVGPLAGLTEEFEQTRIHHIVLSVYREREERDFSAIQYIYIYCTCIPN